MRFRRSLIAIAFAATVALPAISAVAQEAIPGDSVESLLAYARDRHPELQAMRHEADAAAQRIDPAGALPDPMFKIELQNITNYGNDGSFSLSPAKVGSTKYTISQSIPFWGKRDLRQGVARSRRAAGRPPRERDLGRARREDQDRLRPVPARGAQRGTRARSAHADGQPGEPRAGALRERPRPAAGRDPRPGRTDRDAHRPGDAGQRKAAMAGEAQQPAYSSGQCAVGGPQAHPSTAAPGAARSRGTGRPAGRQQPASSRSRMRASSRPSADATSPTATAIRISASACRRSRWAAGSTNGS